MDILHLKSVPIFRQLQIEEALLRTDNRNICIINTHVPPAIVMGISGKVEKLLNIALVKQDQIPVIQRFSGGGTVFVDEGTVFVSFIGNTLDFDFTPYPHTLLHWTEQIYRPLFSSLNFQVRENDYVIGEKKIGGNAQYLRKERWLHHTSFLWNFSLQKMEYLLLPEKRPHYRKNRSHGEFLSPLSLYLPCQEEWVTRLKEEILTKFQGKEICLSSIEHICMRSHRTATNFVTIS